MKFIIRYWREIMIKSNPVRKRFTKILYTNISNSLKVLETKFKLHHSFDKIDLEVDDIFAPETIEILKKVPGIELFLIVKTYKFENLEDTKNIALDYYKEKIEWKSFVVRVKRVWNHVFGSLDAEKEIGWHLFHNSKNTKVSLKNPEIIVNIEIQNDKFHLVTENIRWVWGYPVWVQERVISLISGWFDSSVSSFLMAKRWVRVDYLFFKLGWITHEIWVKQISKYIWQTFSPSYKAKFISVDFEKLSYEIVTKIETKYRWVILKILMHKVAEMITQTNAYYWIVTGESIGQVSSQTLINMSVIDSFTNALILRPLITFNKQEIIEIAKNIWTYNYSLSMPEYCWMISVNPTTEARLDAVVKEFEKLDIELINEAFQTRITTDMRGIFDDEKVSSVIEKVYEIKTGEILIDIREEDKRIKNPLKLEKVEILNIPFYDINSRFEKLDKNKDYLFYCDKWILSELHALYLKEKGFNNIKIFRKWKKI